MGQISIDWAVPADVLTLKEIFRRSSLSNAPDRAALLANPAWLELDADAVLAGHTRVARHDGELAGFATLRPLGTSGELDDLFVDPPMKRLGIARRLVEDLAVRAAASGLRWIEVTGNEEALAFYTAVGFVRVGTADTPLRPAPRLRLDLA